jgi:hypothetical protein
MKSLFWLFCAWTPKCSIPFYSIIFLKALIFKNQTEKTIRAFIAS